MGGRPPKIADYPFTTPGAQPRCGLNGEHAFTVADVPLTSAHPGPWSGADFLRHRALRCTGAWWIALSPSRASRDPISAIDALKTELACYTPMPQRDAVSGDLAARPRAVVLNKSMCRRPASCGVRP